MDLAYRPDWVAFASPFYLTRAGAVGVYGGLFPAPNIDVQQAEVNLLLLMTGIVRAFSTAKGFWSVIQQFGKADYDI